MSILLSTETKFSFKLRSRKISVKTLECSFIRKGFGLMFRTVNTGNLLFSFKKDVKHALTAWFVFFPFIAIWLDKNNKVLETRIVKPFTSTILPQKPFRKVLEMPLTRENLALFDFPVGERNI